MDLNDPKINVLNISLAAGAERKIEDFGGSARAFFFSPALTLGNSLEVTFGPTGAPVALTGFNGVYIRLGGPVSEIRLRNTGAGLATGQIIASSSCEFLMIGL